jgi:hypothetical protein
MACRDEYKPLPTPKAEEVRPRSPILTKPSFYYDGWYLESAAILLSVISLGGIYIVAVFYNGRMLFEWDAPFSLNAVIAVLGTLLKGSAMLAVTATLCQLRWNWLSKKGRRLEDFQIFDAASRGPLGSVWLLSQLRFRLFGLPSIGALVVIVALASDSFLQAAVTYPLRPRIDDPNGSWIAVARNYSAHGDNWLVNRTGYWAWDASSSMKSALYAGALAPPRTDSQVLIACVTGNCTVGPYTTLEIGSQCIDSTTTLTITKAGNIYNATWILDSEDVQTDTELSLAAGPGLANFITLYTRGWLDLRDTDDLMRITSTHLILFDGVSTNNTDYGSETPSRFHAYTCNFHLAVQVYNSSIRQGSLSEYHGVRHMRQWSICNDYSPGACPHGIGAIYSLEQRPDEDLVTMSDLSYLSLSAYLAGIDPYDGIGVLNGNGTGTMSGENIVDFSGNQYPIVQWSNDVIKAIHDAGHYSANSMELTWAHMAQSMTLAMRMSNTNIFDRDAGLVYGPATSLQPYIHIRWAWLALPSAVVVVAALLLWIVALQTRELGVPLWKGSALAVALHGFHETESEHQKLGKISEMNEWATRKRVVLVIDESKGWALRSV